MADVDLYPNTYPKHPKAGEVVMIKVKAINDEGALVSLLEFSNIEGMIKDSSCHHTKVGRIEPAIVLTACDSPRVSIILSRDEIPHVDRRACELRYLDGKYLQTILRNVDISFERPHLEETDNFFLFPSLELLSDTEFMDTLPECLRNKLKDAVCRVTYFSWRMGGHERARQDDPFLILPSSLVQKKYVCWAIAMVRQFEAVLRMKGRLLEDEHLSIQNLINKTKDLGVRGDIGDLEKAARILTQYGIVLEDECPLTFEVPNAKQRTRFRTEVTGTEFVATSVTVYDDDLVTNDFIEHLLHYRAPLAASVIWFKSYRKNNPHGIDIYKPTKKEWEASKRSDGPEPAIHTMLLTGSGIDEHGTHYWEFQDSGGDINYGDRGFIRFIQEPGIIIEVVDIEV